MKNSKPPKLFLCFFRWFCHPKLRDHIEGDLMELYKERVREFGKRKADRKFVIDVLLLFRRGIIKPTEGYKNLNTYGMYKSYFKITLRNLWSNKSFSFINISGLAVGIATCVLIMLYVFNEMQYDKHHINGKRIYRVSSEVKDEKWVAAPAPMAEALKKDFPEVEQVTRLLRFPGTERILLKDEPSKKQLFEANTYYVDSTFFQLFTYDFKFGSGHTALSQPNSIVLSEQVATIFFGNENPVGRILNVGLSFGNFNYTVKGVFRNSGNKSHIPSNILLSMNNGDVGGWVKNQTSWTSNNLFHTYVKLTEHANAKTFEAKLNGFFNQHGGKELKEAGFSKTFFIQPLEDIYLHSNYGYEVAPNGNIKSIYIFTSIAAFLLLIACINFMNLSTARSEKRTKEVGMRKVSGATRGSLVFQFLCESLITSGIALVLALALIQIITPAFNQLINKQLTLSQVPYAYPWLIALTAITGLISGLYPSFYLSSFRPGAVLKGKRLNTISAVAIRRGLVIFQFTVSTMLILGAIVIGQQMDYLSNQSLGFNKNQKIILPIQTSEGNKNFEALRNELLNNAQVANVARGGSYPGIENVASMLFYAEGKPALDNIEIQTVYAEDNYIETLGIEILKGRSLDKDLSKDVNSVVLNEMALNKLGYPLDDAVGRKVYFEFKNTTQSMTIIGVVKDYHFQSLHQQIKPMLLSVAPLFSGPTSYLIADVKSTDYFELIKQFQKTWDRINVASPFEYSFLDQDFQKNYEKEEQTANLIQYFTFVAISIACLGLFGLAAFTAEQRVKEIGVRKVLGASATQIVALLSKDFLKLVVAAIMLSLPIAYYIMNDWLQGFAYQVSMQWWMFAVAGVLTILIALFTVGFQAAKSAFANPAKSLRSE
jgi:putative ABC transport system permease protein